jgi:3-dehydrosphinganine reductase
VTGAGAAKAPAFITGGSSGIGLDLAKLLARRGHSVAIFARDSKKLQLALNVIHQDTAAADIRLYPVDVGQRKACLDAVQQAVMDLGAPGWAIANAGIAVPGEFLTQSLDAHEAQMSVNYMGALYFAKAVTPAMTPGGKLVFVSSGAAFFGVYGYSAYAPSKFAMRGLAEVLRVELAPRGIHVTLAYPPDTDTPMLEAENRVKPEITKKISESGGLWSSLDVAKAILKGADRGRFAVTPGAQMTALLWLHSLLAPALRRWQAGIVKRWDRTHR